MALSPVLGVEDDHPIAEGEGRLLDQKLDLIHGGSAGESCLAVAAQHQIVRHIHRIGHYIL